MVCDNRIVGGIGLSATTRSMGFGTAETFRNFYCHSDHYCQMEKPTDIYAFYRVALGLFDIKLGKPSGLFCCNLNVDYAIDYNIAYMFQYEHILSKRMFKLIATPINSLGVVKIHDITYVPKKLENRSYGEGNNFLPQPEHVYLSNLRQTVVALADERTPVKYRKHFYLCNPIPGAQWRGQPNDPVLVNPDEIISTDYDPEINFPRDSREIRDITYHCPDPDHDEFIPINFEREGSKALLVCNELGNLKVTDRHLNENLVDYYHRIKLEGNADQFSSLKWLNKDEQIMGCVSLLGERAHFPECRYPFYITRDLSMCTQIIPLNYRSAFDYYCHSISRQNIMVRNNVSSSSNNQHSKRRNFNRRGSSKR